MNTVRIAMWSGPRNISTAMMRSFGSRDDCVVVDEPLYAHYLKVTGKDHPGAAEVLAHHESDWRAVVRDLVAPLPAGKTVHYQKHMAHHLLPAIGRDWLDQVTHAFLIRDPGEMLTSLFHQIPEPTLLDTGLPQQLEIFERVRAAHRLPPVLDARDVLEDPAAVLGALCQDVGIPFQEAMLAWEPGPRPTDGVWGRHWYDAVWRSTRFQPYRSKAEALPARFQGLLAECRVIYDELHRHRLQPG